MCVIADRRCMWGVVGPFGLRCRAVTELEMISEVEVSEKVTAERVILP